MAIGSTSLFSFTVLLILFSLTTINGDANLEEQQHNFHTIDISSLFPSDSCASPAGLKKEASLLLQQVVHKHGPCAQAQQQEPSSDNEILRQDQSRVDSIHSRSRKADDVRVTESTITIPAKEGSTVGSGNYIVSIGLGTPATKLSMILDTGSDWTWTQCKPCVKSCYHHKGGNMFQPSHSTSYQNVSCERAACSAVTEVTGLRDCLASTCVYGIPYGHSSYSIGLLAIDKLSFTSTDVVHDFYFGCAHNNSGINFGGAAGFLGLGRNLISLVGQTEDKYNKIFSYCLPSTASSTGFLSFRSPVAKTPLVYTPIVSVADFYGLSITAISVAGLKLPVSASVFSTAKAIIDSGTVITRLPPAAYSALRSAFRKQMSGYPMAPPMSTLDTCYDLTKYKNVKVPKIGFFFAGGAEVEIQSVGILYGSKVSQMCLAFAGNGKPTDLAIFGSAQQKTMEVVYDDSAGGKIGFASAACS